MFFKLPGKIGFLFIAIPDIPERSIYIEGPAGVVVEALSIPIPAVTHIIIQNCLCMIQHDRLVDGIAFHMKKSHIQHIKQPPILGNCTGMSVITQERCDDIAFLFGISIPDLCFADPQADDQGAGLNGLLKASGVVCAPGKAHQILIGSHKKGIGACAGAKHLIFIVILQ